METRIKVVICNTSPLFRQGLKVLCRQGSSIEIVGEASTGKQAIEQVARLRPDIVLMDVATPELTGFEATRRIKANNPKVKVLILTLYDDDDDTLVSLCLRAGASGYVSKDAPMAELVKTMQALHRGGDYRHRRAA